MKRSDDATPVGGTDTTAWPWWQARHGDASQLPTGTIRVRAPQSATSGRARSARIWRHAGSRVVAEVVERASGPNAERPTRTQLRTNRHISVRVVAQRDRLTRWGAGDGAGDRATLRALHGRRGALDCPTDTETGAGLVDDVVAVRTTRAARIAGRCTAGVEQVLRRDSEEA
jgi:hypothetical protein